MSEKKVVSRNIVIGVSVVCLVLVVAFAGTISYYPSTLQSKDAQIAELQSRLAVTQGWLNGNISELNTLNAELQNLSTTTPSGSSDTVTGTALPTIGNSSQTSDIISSLNTTINNLQSTITDLNNKVNTLTEELGTANSQITSLQDQNSQLQSQNSILQSQLDSNTSALALGKNTVWVNSQTVSQPAGGFGISYSYWTFTAAYAGYIIVNVQSSTTASTDIQVSYTYGSLNYNQQIANIGQSGSRVFPVLPSSVQIGVGNGNLVGGATETVTITYIY